MNTLEVNAVITRLDRLEKENRLLKRVGATVLVFLVAAILVTLSLQPRRGFGSGAPSAQVPLSKVPKVVAAEALHLLAQDGTLRATLEPVAKGAVLRLGIDGA
jgi:uncharacterized membrane protein